MNTQQTTDLLESIKELKTFYLQLKIENNDLQQRVYFLESYTGLGNGIIKPMLSPAGVEQVKAEYILKGREEMIKLVMQTSFNSNLLNNL